MRRPLAAAAAWLALGARAAALAPAAGAGLAPAAGQGLDQNSTWWWTRHAKPQQEEAQAAQEEQQDALPPPAWAQGQAASGAPGGPAPPPEVRSWPAGTQPPAGELVGMQQGGFCVDKPIFEGPTMGWEDCRAKCRGPCKFYSYWHDSVTHRCKLTMGCRGRGSDGRHSVSAYQKAQDTTEDAYDMDQQ